MNETSSPSASPPSFAIGYCDACGAYTYPPQAYGCRRCGVAVLQAVALPVQATLQNFVTLHTELTPELEVPCVIGEVRLAPGVIEEALIGVADEAELSLGQALIPQAYKDQKQQWRWRFVPAVGEIGGLA